MRLEIVVSKSVYHYYKIALLEVKPTFPADRERINISFRDKHVRVIVCRRCTMSQLRAHRKELEQIKTGLEAMGLETTFFHHRLGFRFESLVTQPVEKRNFYTIEAGNKYTYIMDTRS